jgi:thymidylate synthase
MHLKSRNVNTSFRTLVDVFATAPRANGVRMFNGETPIISRPSRNGNVLMIDEPVTITYSRPRERVLFNRVRDANPFFHVVESLWMLAGRNDVALPAYYVKRMAEFSDDGKTLNGAYGYRWRKARGGDSEALQVATDDRPGFVATDLVDQLDILVNHLKANPDSRRAVLSMWNVEDDLLKVGGIGLCYEPQTESTRTDTMPYRDTGSKDVCCNLNVMFSLRTDRIVMMRDPSPNKVSETSYLDMTVTSRSNDLVWGMLGANYVTFTFLQEYMAARLGAKVGVYHHFTNNLHVYVDRPDWQPAKLLEGVNSGDDYNTIRPYIPPLRMVPLVRDPQVFDSEVRILLASWCGDERKTMGWVFTEPFIKDVALPMMAAYDLHRLRCTQQAIDTCLLIEADDWRIASTEWLKRRLK